jgi:hypothetical protein
MRRTAAIAILREVLQRAAWFPAAVFALHVVLSKALEAYRLPIPVEIPMHLLGGFAIAYFLDGILVIVARHRPSVQLVQSARLVLAFALVCAATVLWEVAEFLFDQVFGTRSRLSLENSLVDVLVGTVGGVGYVAWRVLSAKR